VAVPLDRYELDRSETLPCRRVPVGSRRRRKEQRPPVTITQRLWHSPAVGASGAARIVGCHARVRVQV